MKQHDGGEEVKGRRSRRWSGKGREREIEREWGQEWEREIVRERSREGGRGFSHFERGERERKCG